MEENRRNRHGLSCWQVQPRGAGAGPPRRGLELIEQVAAGNIGSFDQLHTLTSTFVLRIADAVIRDHSQAEEVTQEVFLEVWRTAGRFDPAKGSAESWLRRLAHSRAVDRVRHAQASRIHDHLYALHHHVRGDVDDVLPAVLARAAAARSSSRTGPSCPHSNGRRCC